TGPAGVTGAFGYWRTTGEPIVFPAKATVVATGGIGKAYEVTSNSWEYSGDGHALAYQAGAELIDMEVVQFHPTGIVRPPGGRGAPHGGVLLDISYLPADLVRRKLPSMYEQFKELADVDITKGPMEVGPTTHYVMGGIRVDAETGASTVAGLFAAGEASGGMNG